MRKKIESRKNKKVASVHKPLNPRGKLSPDDDAFGEDVFLLMLANAWVGNAKRIGKAEKLVTSDKGLSRLIQNVGKAVKSYKNTSTKERASIITSTLYDFLMDLYPNVCNGEISEKIARKNLSEFWEKHEHEILFAYNNSNLKHRSEQKTSPDLRELGFMNKAQLLRHTSMSEAAKAVVEDMTGRSSGSIGKDIREQTKVNRRFSQMQFSCKAGWSYVLAFAFSGKELVIEELLNSAP